MYRDQVLDNFYLVKEAGLGYAMYEEEPKGSINKHARDEAYYAYLSVKKG